VHNTRRHHAIALAFGIVLILSAAGVAGAQTESSTTFSSDSTESDLSGLSLEDLMNVQVTSVSKEKQRIADAPGAVTVINQEDIDRSGMTTIPDLLSLAPGLDVERSNASSWAIGSRDSSYLFDNSLLVLMDGRSVYTPQFGGVYWNTVDYVLPDIDRIEVIRGPGATVWGANAVDGVVNIVTKPADETQGWLIRGLGGTQQDSATIRYGGKLDDDTYYRVYAKWNYYPDQQTASGGSAYDSWNSYQGGFRIDKYATPQDTITFQGDIYDQAIHQTDIFVNLSAPYSTDINDGASTNGGNLLGRWTHVVSDTSSFSVQAYVDRVDHQDDTLMYQQDTADINFQHNFALTARQAITWGGEYRIYATRAVGSSQIVFSPVSQGLQLVSGFVQDDVTLVRDRLHFFLGTKVEDDSYTNLQFEPSARLMWTPDSHNSVWGAVSESTLTPSRYQEGADIRFASFPNGTGTTLVEGMGNNGLEAQKLLAYELGYRVEPTKSFSVDIAGFFNQYRDLLNNQTEAPIINSPAPPSIIIPEPTTNDFSAVTYGGELQATWRVVDNVKLIGSYAYVDGHQIDGAGNKTNIIYSPPANVFQLRSYIDLTKSLQLNVLGSYQTSQDSGGVPPYWRLDCNIAWHPTDQIEIMVGGQNLLNAREIETDLASYTVQTAVPRSLFARVTYSF
jgi:iron complex outermembrane receptor protein